MENIVLERFARPVGKHATSVAPQGVRKLAAGGFQMTLQAQFELPFPVQPRRVDNCAAYGIERRSGPGALHMGASGTVTALAIDPLGNCAAKKQLSPYTHLPCIDFRVGVVAEEAFLIDLAPKVRMIPTVVTRIHGPESAVFRIPGNGRLDKLTVGSLV